MHGFPPPMFCALYLVMIQRSYKTVKIAQWASG